MITILDRLSSKLILITVILLSLLAIATAVPVVQGFQQTQEEATLRSIEGLEAQGQTALFDLTQREAQLTSTRLEQVAIASRHAVDYLIQMSQTGGTMPYAQNELVLRETGAFVDDNPNRITDIYYVPRTVNINDPVIEHQLQETASFDALFPTLNNQYPDAQGIYYISKEGFTRYYPTIDLEGHYLQILTF